METSQQITSNARAFQLKGSLFTLTVLQLQTTNILPFVDQLKNTVAQSPKFFRNAPVVIDLQKLVDVDEPIDFSAISDQLRHQGMIPVGVRGGNDEQHKAAKGHGLGILHSNRTEKAKPAPTNTHQPAKIISQPVRSGQQIYAQHGDLIVLSPVGQGAEVMADGNIHIYAPLRGRALAGVNGDKTARIFCQQLDAELVSIAGYYLAHEDIKAQLQDPQPAQVTLQNTSLEIAPL